MGNSEKNLPLMERALNELIGKDFQAAAHALLGSSYPNEKVNEVIARMPADVQAAIRSYFRWYSANYDAEHSCPPGAVAYPAGLPLRGYGWGKGPAPGTVAAAPGAAPAPAFTAYDLEHRLYGYRRNRQKSG